MYAGSGIGFITSNGQSGDEFVLGQATSGNVTTINGFGSGQTLGLDSTAFGLLGGAGSQVGVSDAANSTALGNLQTTNVFAYEQDNGFLYYSQGGSFGTGGGSVHIATIHSSGTTAWTFAAGNFQAA